MRYFYLPCNPRPNIALEPTPLCGPKPGVFFKPVLVPPLTLTYRCRSGGANYRRWAGYHSLSLSACCLTLAVIRKLLVCYHHLTRDILPRKGCYYQRKNGNAARRCLVGELSRPKWLSGRVLSANLGHSGSGLVARVQRPASQSKDSCPAESNSIGEFRRLQKRGTWRKRVTNPTWARLSCLSWAQRQYGCHFVVWGRQENTI